MGNSGECPWANHFAQKPGARRCTHAPIPLYKQRWLRFANVDVFDFNWHLTSLYASPSIGNSNREASAEKKQQWNEKHQNTHRHRWQHNPSCLVLAQQYYPPFFPSEKEKKNKAVEPWTHTLVVQLAVNEYVKWEIHATYNQNKPRVTGHGPWGSRPTGSGSICTLGPSRSCFPAVWTGIITSYPLGFFFLCG